MTQQEPGDVMSESDVTLNNLNLKVQAARTTFSCLIFARSPLSKSSLYSAPLVLAPARAVT